MRTLPYEGHYDSSFVLRRWEIAGTVKSPSPERGNCIEKSMEALMEEKLKVGISLLLLTFFVLGASAWTGEIHGRVVCDVCDDSSIGPEDHILEGAEVAVLCITKSGEVLNYQAFTDSRGIYTVAETMPESDRWDDCLARPISSFHKHCTDLSKGSSGVKFSYNHPSGYSHTVRTFVYRPSSLPTYCI